MENGVHDAQTPPNEWAAFTGAAADPGLRDGRLEIWRRFVVPRFEARYTEARALP
jgi:hypothetical protein